MVAQQIGASIGLVVVANATATSATDAGRLTGYHYAYLTAAALCVLGAVIITFGGRWNSHPESASEYTEDSGNAPIDDTSRR